MRWAAPQIKARGGGRPGGKRFRAEAAELRANPLRWADLEVPEQGRNLYDLSYNLRDGRYKALPPDEFEFAVWEGRLYARYAMRA